MPDYFTDENPPLLIECGDNLFAPYHFVCSHLAQDPTLGYGRIELHPEDYREVEYDYACHDCLDLLEDTGESVPMIAMCIYCVRTLLDLPVPSE